MIRRALALLIACALLDPTAALTAERVRVRAGAHAGFSRLVFDWTRPVGRDLEQRGAQATLRFDRMAELDLRQVRADPPPYLNGIAVEAGGTGTALALTVAPGARLRLFDSEGKVVLDILRPDGQEPVATAPALDLAAAAGPPPPPPPAKPAAKPATTSAATSAATSAKPADAPATGQPQAAPLPPVSEPIQLLVPKPETTPAPPASPAAQAAAPQAQPPATTPEPAKVAPPPSAKPKQAPPAPARAAAPRAAPAPAASAPEPRRQALVSVAPTPVLIETAPRPARAAVHGAPVALRFDWPSEVGAAAYRRAGELWLAFDQPAPGDLSAALVKDAPQLAPIEQYSIDGGTLIRLRVPPVAAPQLRRHGTAWVLELWSRGPRLETAVALEVPPDAGATEVILRLGEPGRVLSFTDPLLGDRLIVVPALSAGQALPGGHAFPQFEILESLQGLVVQPLSDGLAASAVQGGIALRDGAGLIVSQGGSLARLKENQPSPPRGPRLLDPEAWRRGGLEQFPADKQALQKALARAEPVELPAARLDLARFYFGHGLAAEALGVLRLGATDAPRLALHPQARLIKGASEVLTEDYAAAAEDLFHPALEGEWEARLWQAAYAAAGHDWAVAAEAFAATVPLIAAYPRAVRNRLRLLAAEAHLGIADAAGAEPYLDAIRGDSPSHGEEAQLAFLVGRRLQLEGDPESAEALWHRVAASRHAASRTRARLALLDLGLERGKVSAEEAIAELERLRFAWRGDRFEFALLQRLGELYLARADYRKGLTALRQAASYLPDSERAQAVAQRMREVFAALYLGEDGRTPPSPLAALALYEEFKELTPPGERGDAVITALADRLVEVDLLERAAELLNAQVRYRLEGLAKAKVGARLAVVRLLDRTPAKALEALEISAAPNLPQELVVERRLLRVRALRELGRYGEALAELGDADGRAARRLRADVLWAKQDWPAAARAYERLLPEPPAEGAGLEPEQGQDVLGLAIALTLAGEREGLLELGKAYGAAMAAGPQAQTFALLVGDLEPGRLKSIAEELAQVDQVEAFLTSYRRRLQEAALSRLN